MRIRDWRTTALPVLALILLAAPRARAADPLRTHDITIDDYFTIAVVNGCRPSPDGRYVAYTEQRWNPPEEKRNTDLWVVESDGGRAQRLTFDPCSDEQPRWSPDGRWIYFLSSPKREGEKDPPHNGDVQVWRVTPDGGEPRAVTRVKDGVGAFQLSRDGRTLYYTHEGEGGSDEWSELRKTHSAVKYGHGKHGITEIWKLDLESWRAEKLVDDGRYVREFAVSPDGRCVAMLTTAEPRLLLNEGWSRVDVFDVESKRTSTLPDALWRSPEHVRSPHGWIESLAWSGDSAALAFTVSWDGYPAEMFAAEWQSLSGRTTAGAPGSHTNDPTVWRLTRADEVYAAGGLAWRGDTRDLCFVGDRRATQSVYCIADVRSGAQGATKTLTPPESYVDSFALASTGRDMAVVMSDLFHPPDVFRLEAATPDAIERLTRVNPQVDTWKLPQISRFSWKGAGGVEVEGILELPPDAKPGEKLPLVVELHGGPTASVPFCLQYWIYGRTMFPAKGYALLSPNYRGSTGYGDKFLTDLIGHENDVDVADILAGVDALISAGVADGERMGVLGWSNGGYLANCVITTTTRFKAASSGAGVLDQFMQWGTQDTPGHNINYMGGLPWAAADAYRRASPSFKLDRVTTPTLIHVGEKDERVPAVHSRALFRALRDYVKIPTELLVYPGEGHGLTKYSHRKAKMEWDAAWFERYVLGKMTQAPERPAAAESERASK